MSTTIDVATLPAKKLVWVIECRHWKFDPRGFGFPRLEEWRMVGKIRSATIATAHNDARGRLACAASDIRVTGIAADAEEMDFLQSAVRKDLRE